MRQILVVSSYISLLAICVIELIMQVLLIIKM